MLLLICGGAPEPEGDGLAVRVLADNIGAFFRPAVISAGGVVVSSIAGGISSSIVGIVSAGDQRYHHDCGQEQSKLFFHVNLPNFIISDSARAVINKGQADGSRAEILGRGILLLKGQDTLYKRSRDYASGERLPAATASGIFWILPLIWRLNEREYCGSIKRSADKTAVRAVGQVPVSQDYCIKVLY